MRVDLVYAVGTTLTITIHLSRLSCGGLIGFTKGRELCRFILGFVQTKEIEAIVARVGWYMVRFWQELCQAEARLY